MSDKEHPTASTPEHQSTDKDISPSERKDLVSRFLEKGRQPQTGEKVPSLEHEQTYGYGKNPSDFDAEMERELQEAMGELSEAGLYGEAMEQKRPKATPGAKKAKVYRVHGQDVFLDLPGGRTQGLLPITQFPEGAPAPGTEVEVEIDGFDSSNGLYVLSRKGAVVEVDWSSVAPGMIVEARVTETNKGGLSVEVNGIRGFMPISQIELFRVETVDQYVNQKLRCMVAEVDPMMHNLVVSRRALLDKEREETRGKLWEELQEGQVFNGLVKTVKDFGAFVDIGGIDGLLHVSELSWTRVSDAREVLKPGETVKVVVSRIDREKRKISLGHRQLLTSPWDDVEAKYPVGSVVSGKVTRLADFGAFVELEPGIEGLIHISEVAPQRVFRVSDFLQIDQDVQVSVLSIDVQQRRISLSLKATLPSEPEPTTVEEEPEEEQTPKPQRPRTTPLRGGVGGEGPIRFDLK